MSNLLVAKGPNVGVKYPLARHTSIGRSRESDIQLLDINVSRSHCEIVQEGRTFTIRDLGSRNGMLINGHRVQEKTLQRNDVLVIGSTTFLFDTDNDLKNTRFSNKRVYFASPAEETIVRLAPSKPEPPPSEEEPKPARRIGGARDLLCHLGQLFSSSQLPLPEALERILQTLLTTVNATCGCLMTCDAVSKEFVPLIVLSDDDEFSVSQNVIKCVLEEKQPVLLSANPSRSHLVKTLHLEPETPAQADEQKAALCVPLLHGREVTGLIYLELPRGDQLLLNDIQVLETVATLTQLAIEHSNALDQLELTRSYDRPSEGKLIGKSPAFLKSISLIDRIAGTGATVLLTGETGTGKEMVAREIHRRSGRANYPFVAINCGAIPDELIESELFGYERGAFTGAERMRRGLIEHAHGGTLLLDEIGDMNLAAQSKLLRFLQDQIVTRVGGHTPIRLSVRVIAATNVELLKAVREKKFREDLWYRLNVFEICLPPLRERIGDIRLLAEHFLKRYRVEYEKPILTISDAAILMLDSYTWPGNVREMQNAIARATLMCDGSELDVRHFSVPQGLPLPTQADAKRPAPFAPLEPELITLAEAEKRCIQDALEACNWNQAQAARCLQVHRNTLRKKIADYDIAPPEAI